MSHSVRRKIKVRTVNEFIREIEENGQRVEIEKANSDGMLMRAQGVAISYWQGKQTLALQGENEDIQAPGRQFEKCRKATKNQKYEQKRSKISEAATQLDQRRHEMSELLVFIIERASKYPTKEMIKRITAKGKRMQGRGESKHRHMTIDGKCEDKLITEFKSALLGQICSKMPQRIQEYIDFVKEITWETQQKQNVLKIASENNKMKWEWNQPQYAEPNTVTVKTWKTSRIRGPNS